MLKYRPTRETEPFAVGLIAALLYLLLVLLAFDAGCARCCEVKEDTAALMSAMDETSSLVAVYKLDAGDDGSCTAWKVEGVHPLLVTAEHCCSKNAEHPLSLDGQRVYPVAADPVADVCLIAGLAPGRGLKLAEEMPKLGEPVWAAGYPFGIPMRSLGLFGRTDGDGKCYATTFIAPGYSGAPLLNMRGEVVCSILGFPHIRGDQGYPGITIGYSVARVRALLDKIK